MKLFVILSVLFSSFVSNSQTKLISHKSHSGSDETFAIALENNLFDIEDSNLGHAPNRSERNAVLDSVIYVSDKETIIITSEQCVQSDREDFKILNQNKWRSGKETLYNHKLFSKNHSLDSIKKVLKTDYNFRNDISKVTFIGFDNKPEKSKKKRSIFLIFPNFPNITNSFFLVIILGFLSVLVYFFSSGFKFHKTNLAN